MKAGRPSRTARFVTIGRAMADAGMSHVPGFRDPTARVFLDQKAKRSLAKTEGALRGGKRTVRLEMARVLTDMMALRTSAVDRAVREAVAGGVRQIVILGAGYDGRAWRMPELAGLKVFEVDHPSTQGDKRARLNELTPPIGIVTFVPIDFETESLDAVLERAGHNRTLPTCWLWEGVVMYLTRDAMRATLASIAGRSAPGSTLIVNYHTTHRGLVTRLVFWLIGEPQISSSTPEEIAADLRSVGFHVREDSGMLDWNTLYAHGEANVGKGFYMRLAIARS